MLRVVSLRLLLPVLLLSPLLLDSATGRAFQEGPGAWKKSLGKLLVREMVDASTEPSTADSVLSLLGLENPRHVGGGGWMLLDVHDGENVTAKLERLQGMGYTAEYDWEITAYKTPNDFYWGRISYEMNSISAPKAWDTFTGSSAVKVCVIDTGIDFSHPDLKANCNLTSSHNAIINRTGPTAAMDDSTVGHGTHCAGVLGAVGNNGVGVTGVVWKVQLLGCKFLSNKGAGSTSGAINCIHWCRQQNTKITSNSWGFPGRSQALADEITLSKNAGHLFIAAAGNSGANTDKQPEYPAAFPHANIISVGATDTGHPPCDECTGFRAKFSNYGPTSVDLFAPGVNIYSTVLNKGYNTLSGTSMACPHVAGAAALLWAYKPSLTAAQVKQALLHSVDKIMGLSSPCVSGGRLNVSRALLIPNL